MNGRYCCFLLHSFFTLYVWTPISPADLADYADKPQSHNIYTNCLSLRNNAACCIPLRPLRYLRETSSSCSLHFICVICERIGRSRWYNSLLETTSALADTSAISPKNIYRNQRAFKLKDLHTHVWRRLNTSPLGCTLLSLSRLRRKWIELTIH